MTNTELKVWMEKLEKKIDRVDSKVSELSADVKVEMHKLDMRLSRVEDRNELRAKVVSYLLGSGGLLGTILAIIHIFKALTN